MFGSHSKTKKIGHGRKFKKNSLNETCPSAVDIRSSRYVRYFTGKNSLPQYAYYLWFTLGPVTVFVF